MPEPASKPTAAGIDREDARKGEKESLPSAEPDAAGEELPDRAQLAAVDPEKYASLAAHGGERLQRVAHVLRAHGPVVMERIVDLRRARRDAVEAAVLDPKCHRLPERGDLRVRPAVLELPRPRLGEIAHEVHEAGDR